MTDHFERAVTDALARGRDVTAPRRKAFAMMGVAAAVLGFAMIGIGSLGSPPPPPDLPPPGEAASRVAALFYAVAGVVVLIALAQLVFALTAPGLVIAADGVEIVSHRWGSPSLRIAWSHVIAVSADRSVVIEALTDSGPRKFRVRVGNSTAAGRVVAACERYRDGDSS